MSRAKSLLALLVVAVGIALLFLPRGGGPADETTSATSITLYGYDDGAKPSWKIRAANARIDGPGQTLDGVSIEFYGDDPSSLGIRGDRLDRSEGVAHLSGHVRIERADDLFLETEALTWIEAEDRLETGPISLSADILRVTAARFGYDLDTGTASFTDDVEAVIDLETDWTIRAERAEERDGLATFHDGVTAESESGETFRCERLEVDSQSEVVRLFGDVTGDWPAGELTADSVRWDQSGTRASGRVAARLDLEEMRTPNGT